MSKLIESLRASAREFAKKEQGIEESVLGRKTEHQLTQEQLAEIYFSSPEKVKRSDQPLVIKVIEKQRAASVLPWIVASFAFLIAAFALFSTKRIFVDIKVIDEKNLSLLAAGQSQNLTASPTFDASSSETSPISYGDKLPMQNFIFEGAAKLQSSKDKSSLVLVNSSVAPFARASLRFDTPINLKNSKIVFYAKGARGGENIALAIKDKENVQSFNRGKLYPFPNNLTTDWQKAEIPMMPNEASKFDQGNVTTIRFEIGSKDTDNRPGDTIFVKDLQIIPL